MGYRGSDRSFDRWRDRDEGRRPYGSSEFGRDERGFLDRAGDEVRSWFGDEEAERRREIDERRWARERELSDRGRDFGETAGGGWGNQRGDSWHRDRPGERSFGGGEGEYRGGAREEIFGDDRLPGGTSGFGGYPDHGRRFDRIDAGSTSTHGAHPMSAPAGGFYGGGGFGSSAHDYAALGRGRERSAGLHDPHYSEWRSRQIDEFDRDYDDYRREHQSKFEQDFGAWRSKRQGQRQLLGRVTEHMEVTGSDGEAVGTVDKVRGDRIILTKSGEESGGVHNSIPCSWVESVDEKVILNKTAAEAKESWRSEEENRAFFDRDERGGEGPHMLNRSFAGTYGRRE